MKATDERREIIQIKGRGGGGLKPCLITRVRLSFLVVNPRLLSRFQIGAYDQQIWEKSVEQREIKVRRFWAQFGSGPSLVLDPPWFWPPSLIFPHVFCSFQFSLLVISPVFLLRLFLFCLFHSFLSDRGGGGVTPPSLLSSSPSLLLHPLLSSSAVYFSGEYSAGGGPSLSAQSRPIRNTV